MPVDALAAAALTRAGEVGPYFAVETDPVADAGWRPISALFDDPALVAERVGSVRAVLSARAGLPLADVETRAAASIHFLGLASRLVAPALGATCLSGVVTTVDAGDLCWQPVEGGPVPLAVLSARGQEVRTPDSAAELLVDGVVRPVVAPLAAAFARVAGHAVAPRVLWGNVASALAGATGMLLRSGAEFALDPLAVASAMLGDGPLAGTGAFGRDGRFFRRSSCCLFYRIPGGGTCGDCVLD